MKAVVDQDLCVGCGMCEGTCPAVFSMNEEGQAQAIAGEIPEGELSAVEDAKDSCPVGAISLK